MYRVRKRDGELVDFNISKISNAITKEMCIRDRPSSTRSSVSRA